MTKWAAGLGDVNKLLIGQILVSVSLAMYRFIQGIIPMYYVSMVLFTIGEIMTTLGSYPYLTRRILHLTEEEFLRFPISFRGFDV